MFDTPVLARSQIGNAWLLTVALPGGVPIAGAAGRFFLARCSAGSAGTRTWDPLLRQPLFPVHAELAGDVGLWSLLLPPENAEVAPWPLRADSAAQTYLHSLRNGDRLNLLGPSGVGFLVEPRTRALLLAADLLRAPLLLPLVEGQLNFGGRVLFLIVAEEVVEAEAFVRRLPLAVEARIEPPVALAATLAGHAGWADQICLALPARTYAQAAAAIRSSRPRLQPGDVQALVEAPLPCGCGACLACVVPLANGSFTRACMHGPVLDLARLV